MVLKLEEGRGRNEIPVKNQHSCTRCLQRPRHILRKVKRDFFKRILKSEGLAATPPRKNFPAITIKRPHGAKIFFRPRGGYRLKKARGPSIFIFARPEGSSQGRPKTDYEGNFFFFFSFL